MKLTTNKLKQLIKEELGLLREETQEECWEMYEQLPHNVKVIVDQFKDTGAKYAVNDLHAAGSGDEGLKKYYRNNTPEELKAASRFLEMWFYDCPQDMGPPFDIEDFLGENTWIMYAENINDIEENLQWYLDTEDIDLEDFDMSFEQLVAMIRKKADEGYGL